MTSSAYSDEFYKRHSKRYAHVQHNWLQSVYIKSSHPRLRSDQDAWDLLKQLAPGKRGLDAGCGSGARDVFLLWSDNYDIVGLDAVEENITEARRLHPEIADRVFVADLQQPIPFEAASFDFVACNAVIQHIPPETVQEIVLPELARVLRPEGVLQLMFKNGSGFTTVFDKDYGVDRTFQLYDHNNVMKLLEGQGLVLVEAESPEELGGFLFFTDPKRVEHCLLFARKK